MFPSDDTFRAPVRESRVVITGVGALSPNGVGRERYFDALASGHHAWGRFDVRIDGGAVLGVVGRMMNLRSRLTGIATGDQALFMTRAAFEAAGGFPDIALMEDVAICKRLKCISPPACLRKIVVTSARRWTERGTFATIVLMWRLRLGFALGADPRALARRYERPRSPS